MKAWVVFNRANEPKAVNVVELYAKGDAADGCGLDWPDLEAVGYTCQLCEITVIEEEE